MDENQASLLILLVGIDFVWKPVERDVFVSGLWKEGGLAGKLPVWD